MDAFVEIFLKIDTNYDGIITRRELEEYTQENHLDPLMIEVTVVSYYVDMMLTFITWYFLHYPLHFNSELKLSLCFNSLINIDERLHNLGFMRWEKLFTEEGKNYITLQNFLDVLGIAKEEFKEKRRQAVEQQSAFFKLGKDVEYIAGDMPLPQQINVSNESRSLIEEYRYDKTELISKTLKNFLDQIFGKSWHQFNNNVLIKNVLHFCNDFSNKQRRQTIEQQSTFFKLGKDIEYIAGDMVLSQQINVSNETRSLLQEHGSDNTKFIAKRLKEFLDKTFSRSWHVMILNGSFWSSYSHEPGTAFHFKLKDQCFNVWKTPDYSQYYH
ncbi:unnamed protein product [Heterobilharzia americana]|nr:unnamed protein product [Heterobilharzia americana]